MAEGRAALGEPRLPVAWSLFPSPALCWGAAASLRLGSGNSSRGGGGGRSPLGPVPVPCLYPSASAGLAGRAARWVEGARVPESRAGRRLAQS